MKVIAAVVCLFFTAGLAFASNGDRFKAVPKEATKITEILQAVNKIKGFGAPSWAMYSLHAGEIRHFVIWFCPFSGRAATYAHSYRHDGKQWKLMHSDLFEKTHTITVNMSKKGFVYRDFQGKELLTVPLRTDKPKDQKNGAKQKTVIEQADTLFEQGHFAKAEKLYRKAPKSKRALRRLGSIALLSNRLDEAANWLMKAMHADPKDRFAKLLLAETYYRQDGFDMAAALLRSAGAKVPAGKLESFKGQKPYDIESKKQQTVLKFVVKDPLPLVKVKVNGSKEVIFLIDTGGAELILDKEFAKAVNAKQFGSQTGTFAGGKTAPVIHGRIDSLTLGDFQIKNLPVNIMKTRHLSRIFGDRRIDGILGAVVLYHFLSTLDYPRNQLILRRRSKQTLQQFEQDNQEAIVVPFWMAGDHYMVSRVKIEKGEPILFFVDTGLAGGGVTCAKSVMDEAGIKLSSSSGIGVGGGGKVKVVPFMVKEMAMGSAKQRNVRGLFLGPFPLENVFGFRIGGIISHGFFRPYALTFDFDGMRLFLKKSE